MFKVKKGITTDPDALMQEVKLSRHSSPRFILDNEEIDLWNDPYNVFVGKSPIEYIRKHVLSCERKGIDPFHDVVGKYREKDLIKNALMSGSQVLLKGKKGYGKTTISKSIAKLLPSRIIGIKDCKIHDDPIEPTCFSCKKKVLEDEVIELEWVPRIWVRIPGDPMLTTRQLIGGISIQRIREGYDLDHPEVFVPGRALKANRGVGYFDELGAVPSSLQTMLHELFEENQVTTSEGDIVPFKIDTLEIAGGCICCTMAASLIKTLETLKNNFNPDFVILEPSGIAYPAQITESLDRSGTPRGLIFALVDISRFEEIIRFQGIRLGRRQVEESDIIIINKIDLATSEEYIKESAKFLKEVNTSAEILTHSIKDSATIEPIIDRLILELGE